MPAKNRHYRGAVEALANREYERAGDCYTRSGWATLADPREGLDPFSIDENGWVGRGLQALTAAVVAYRVAGRPERATDRAREGVAVASDFATTADRPVQAACLREFVADFRLTGGLDGPSEAYQEVETSYEAAANTVEQPQSWATTPLFEAAAATLKQVARGTANGEIAVRWEDLHGSDPSRAGSFLAHRAQFKRQRFASLLEQTLSKGYLAAPRGTTEYGNEQYQCPSCHADDVNWTGESVLCLRCSTPMRRE
ncbi:MAG: hypothetical protein V5A32_02595 [Halovenus sp.]